MAWFKGFWRSQPVKVEFAISHPCAFLLGQLLEMPFLSSCAWKKGRALSPVPIPAPGQGLLSLVPSGLARLCQPLTCSLYPECPVMVAAPLAGLSGRAGQGHLLQLCLHTQHDACSMNTES